jgi:hypothetical protein
MRFAGKIAPAAEQDTIVGCGRRIRRTRPLRRRKFASLWLRLDWMVAVRLDKAGGRGGLDPEGGRLAGEI